jgi:DNA-binding NtrC family response regulator
MKNSGMTKPRILLVDDGQSILNGLVPVLKASDLELVTTTSPHHAMRLLNEGPFEAVVSDQDMPELSGIELVAWVQKNHPEVLRFLLTGQASLPVAVDAMNEGAVHRFFSKPYNSFDLARSIRQAVDHKRLVQSALELAQSRSRDGAAHAAPTLLSDNTEELVQAMRSLLDGQLAGVAGQREQERRVS